MSANKTPLPFLLLFLLFGCTISHSQNAFVIDTSKHLYSANRDTLPYRLVYPQEQDPAKKYPLLVYLHGMGTRGKDNEMPLQKFSTFLGDSTPLAKHPCYILIPQCPEKDVWVSFPNFPKSLSASAEPSPATENV
ncbi:MAG: phospholipase, partial [Bacteroidia bacterium]|nr:phospholipase [Bacteroidia bacterium]